MTDFLARLQHALDADFLIERELGGGGMSRVFVATERALQRKVVIKVMPPELAAGVNVERFKREIQLAAQLSHPHVVPLLATGDQDGILWFSMPFIEGESLRASLQRQKKIPPRDVVRILHDVVDALAYAHARGIVHRDIKPDNIITSGMHAVVLDFGVAKALSAAIPMAGGTTTGMAIGTPAYMAPEQLAADPAADHRVDVYAVGLLAYELLTGRSPFGGSSPQATMAAQLTQMPEPPTKFADIPEALSAVIMHCLEKDAAKRPQSAQALLAELEALPAMTGSGTIVARAPARPWRVVAAAIVFVGVAFAIAQQFRTPAKSATALDARDAGPGGNRAPAAQVPKNATGVVAGAKPETVVVYRNSVDSEAGIQVPVVISRAESLAIVDAFRKRAASSAANVASTAAKADSAKAKGVSAAAVEAESRTNMTATAPGVASKETKIVINTDGQTITLNRAQLAEEIGKIFADSVAMAFSRMDTSFKRAARVYRFDTPSPTGRGVTPLVAPPSDGRSRIVVSNYSNVTGKRELSGVGRDVAHFLRGALPPDKYDIVENDLVDRAARGTSDPLSLGWSLRADYVVNGLIMQRGDSVVILTQFRDVRDGRFMRALEATAPVADPKKAFELSLAHVNGWLDSAKVMRSRRPPGPPRGPGMMLEGRNNN